MIFNIGDIVSLNNSNGKTLYKVLDIWPNGKLKKIENYNSAIKMIHSTNHINEWDSLNFKLYESVTEQPTGPYAHVIRKIKIMDKRFQERKLA